MVGVYAPLNMHCLINISRAINKWQKRLKKCRNQYLSKHCLEIDVCFETKTDVFPTPHPNPNPTLPILHRNLDGVTSRFLLHYIHHLHGFVLTFVKLENCVCKTQVIIPCPEPVLTLCPILTHDPQHIQLILETNV